MFDNIVKIEVDRLHKEAKDRKKEYEKQIEDKNIEINVLLTELEKIKGKQQALQKQNGVDGEQGSSKKQL